MVADVEHHLAQGVTHRLACHDQVEDPEEREDGGHETQLRGVSTDKPCQETESARHRTDGGGIEKEGGRQAPPARARWNRVGLDGGQPPCCHHPDRHHRRDHQGTYAIGLQTPEEPLHGRAHEESEPMKATTQSALAGSTPVMNRRRSSPTAPATKDV